jgi:type II secretory pathway pseudopilin PulG
MIVVSIIGLLAMFAIPSFVRARTTSQMKACIENLRQMDAAKDQWAIENFKTDNDPVDSEAVAIYLKRGLPTCPANGVYHFMNVKMSPTCSTAFHVL